MSPSLAKLGFTPFFGQQLDPRELDRASVARVIEVQRSGITVSDGDAERSVPLGSGWYDRPPEERPTVGDWVVLDNRSDRIDRLLERKTVFKRVAAGTRADVQLVAANIDTLFIVSSCNDDFNESRLERYLALAIEAGVFPVVVLTKADLVPDAEVYGARAREVRRDLAVELVNALDAESLSALEGWISPGATIALVGSSGVGKSTILNTLAGRILMDTGKIRDKDAKGRHTTSFRSLHVLQGGGIVLDVPGMRELKIAELGDALPELFDDIETLAARCRFTDCAHGGEPGCAVRRAIENGELDERRLRNYGKLVREEAFNNSTLAERRNRGREFGRLVKEAVAHKRRSRDE